MHQSSIFELKQFKLLWIRGLVESYAVVASAAVSILRYKLDAQKYS